ncbi:hypothetical protein [Comamonas thiooxydans]|uniref:hypothetical protein n=1 Tax=Comamonas thiooxydans TaxID=363952 RepID=UPI0015A73B46|nr:hypothetical protein [Comamonas thiooxydans]
MKTEELAADLGGMQMAFTAAINALIASHPDPSKLAAMLHIEKQASLAALTAMPIPDRAIDAFHLAWEGLAQANQGA